MKLHLENTLSFVRMFAGLSFIALSHAHAQAAPLEPARDLSAQSNKGTATSNPTVQSAPTGQMVVPPVPAADPAPTNNTPVSATNTNTNAMTATNPGQANPTVGSAVSNQPAVTPVNAADPSVLKDADGKPAGTVPTTPEQTAQGVQNLLQANGAVQNPSATQSAESSNATAGPTGAANNNGLLLPNGAALPSQLVPLSTPDSSPWTAYAAAGFLILGLAAAGVMIVRLRHGKGFGLNKSEKQMQLISTLALSPKRQIVLLRIRDKEVAVASTEHGITLLTEMHAQSRQPSSLLDDGGLEEPRRRKVQQKTVQSEEAPRMIAAGNSENLGQETAIARSEMLMGALKNLREKNLRGKSSTAAGVETAKPSQVNETTMSEKRLVEPSSETNRKPEPTMRQTRAAFPKYLANAFEQESKRTPPTAGAQTGADEAGNVTNMIRERLKDLRPLA